MIKKKMISLLIIFSVLFIMGCATDEYYVNNVISNSLWEKNDVGIHYNGSYVGIGTESKILSNSKFEVYNEEGGDFSLLSYYNGSDGSIQQRIGSFDIKNLYDPNSNAQGGDYFRFVMRYRKESGIYRHQVIQTVYNDGIFDQLFFYDLYLKNLIFGSGAVTTTFQARAGGSTTGSAENIMTIYNGSVGIKNTNPIEPLHVVGNVLIEGNLNVTGCIHYNGGTLGVCI